MSPVRERRCEDCGSPLAGDQRYCLACGARAGDRDERVQALTARARESWGATPSTGPAQGAAAAAATSDGVRTGRLGALPLPARFSAALVAAFLGFGVLLGVAAASSPQGMRPKVAPHLKLVLPAASASTPQAQSRGGSSPTEPPPAEAEATPEPGAGSAGGSSAGAGSAASSAEGSSTAAGGSSSKGGSSSGSQGGSGTGSESQGSLGTGPATKLPPIKHVFVIMLSDEPYAAAFGPASSSQYVTGTLERRGELLAHYDAVAHEELAGGVALLSGQGPTVQTAGNCPTYGAISPASTGAPEQVQGSGCVYPQGTRTLLGQLTEKHLTWRAYVEGIDEPGMASAACAHPQLGAADPTADQTASTGPYATFRNPVVYFASITGSPACARDDVGVGALKGDLARAPSTPSFAYIVPDRCHDGNPTPCTPGAPAGMSAANSFLEKVVPEITGSAAYRESGLLVITSDEAPSSGEYGDSSSCCGQPRFPNLAAPSGGLSPRGGGSVGALLLSPWVKGGTSSQEPFNHFSLLRTIEDVFSLGHIGYAALPAVKPLEPALFTASRSR